LSPPKRLLAAFLAAYSLGAHGQQTLPSLAELEAAGAVIGQIHIRPQNIFDLDDPRENNRLFRFANLLHITTRETPIRRALLFKRGDWLSVRRIDETERLLLANRYLYSAEIRPVAYENGVVDLEVVTRDTWSLKPDISIGREGGVTSGSLGIEEENLLGTGISLSVTRVREVDRSGTQFHIADKHAVAAWTGVDYSYSDLETGENHSFSLSQPFYALDVRAAAGVSVGHNKGIASVYRAGSVVGEYQQTADSLEAFGGWSTGLVNGWTNRFSAGFSHQVNDYELDPTRTAPEALPEDATLTGPFLRYELIQDDVRKLQNFDLIERPEFFSLGLQTSLQVGRAMEGLGSTRDAWLYSFSVSDGTYRGRDHVLLASASVSGRRDELAHRQQLSAGVRYYRRQARDALFFASLSGAVSKSPDISDVLQLGGDNGLRGYPLRYQTGDQRVLLTLEQRVYTDWYPFRLFRVGGAIFYDVGRAWGGKFGQGDANPGWLSDIGIGLRILSTRSAFGNVIHADLAFPVQTGPGIDSVQFLFKTRTSF
jgi:outer membrane protein assembly factor BamA